VVGERPRLHHFETRLAHLGRRRTCATDTLCSGAPANRRWPGLPLRSRPKENPAGRAGGDFSVVRSQGGTEGLGSTETDDPSGGGPSRIDLGCFVLTLLAATPSERAKKKPRPGPGLSEVSNRIRLEGPRRLRCYRELASAGRPMPAATSGYFRAQTGRSVKYRSSDRAWPTPVAPLAH